MLEASFWTTVDGYLTHYSADARIPLYSAEEIRKWLNEDMSDAMMKHLGPPVHGQAESYRDLIAAKLEELK